jgi:hypothetical protein
MAKFFRSERRWPLLVSSLAGAAAVAVTLIVNVARAYPIVSLVLSRESRSAIWAPPGLR